MQVGIAGYIYHQITGDSGSGATLGDFKSKIMGIGPAPAIRKVLERAGRKQETIDLYEVNEAFAPQYLAVEKELRLDRERTNVNGGAIAMGHPLGATGAMILGTVLDELERRDKETALVTLCIGVGMGTATIIERV